jgi:hypothetical protein
MSLDIHFFKNDVDFRKIRDTIVLSKLFWVFI